MCSAPADPGGNVGVAGTTSSQAGATSGGSSSGGSTVIPNAGSAPVGGSGGDTSVPVAGTSATAGTAGAAPTGGSGGASAGGSSAMLPDHTAGCLAPDPGEEPQKWLEKDITVASLPADQSAMYGARKYFVRLPVAYDHTKNYPLVFYGPGCGASNVEGTPMMDQIKNDAIHVFLLQKDSCFSTGGYPSPEVPYFTQALDEVQAKYCTDANRVFVSGYSSGGWLSNVIACAVGPRVRGIGTAAGGLTKSIVDGYKCADMGSPAAGIFYSGQNDTTNPADSKDATGFQKGVWGARDRLIKSNGCDAAAMEAYADNPICQIWKTNCANNPVLFCVGPGDGHGNGGGNFNVSNKTFWDVWSKLPPQ
jgi:hypothetical protein